MLVSRLLFWLFLALFTQTSSAEEPPWRVTHYTPEEFRLEPTQTLGPIQHVQVYRETESFLAQIFGPEGVIAESRLRFNDLKTWDNFDRELLQFVKGFETNQPSKTLFSAILNVLIPPAHAHYDFILGETTATALMVAGTVIAMVGAALGVRALADLLDKDLEVAKRNGLVASALLVLGGSGFLSGAVINDTVRAGSVVRIHRCEKSVEGKNTQAQLEVVPR